MRQSDRFLRAVHRIFLWSNGREFRVRHRENYVSGELLFFWDTHYWIFYERFAVAIRDDFFRRAKEIFVPTIRIHAMNAFHSKTVRQDSGPLNWSSFLILNYDQHLFEFTAR